MENKYGANIHGIIDWEELVDGDTYMTQRHPWDPRHNCNPASNDHELVCCVKGCLTTAVKGGRWEGVLCGLHSGAFGGLFSGK